MAKDWSSSLCLDLAPPPPSQLHEHDGDHVDLLLPHPSSPPETHSIDSFAQQLSPSGSMQPLPHQLQLQPQPHYTHHQPQPSLQQQYIQQPLSPPQQHHLSYLPPAHNGQSLAPHYSHLPVSSPSMHESRKPLAKPKIPKRKRRSQLHRSGLTDEDIIEHIRDRAEHEHVSVQSVRDRLHVGYKRAKRLVDLVYERDLNIDPTTRHKYMRPRQRCPKKQRLPPIYSNEVMMPPTGGLHGGGMQQSMMAPIPPVSPMLSMPSTAIQQNYSSTSYPTMSYTNNYQSDPPVSYSSYAPPGPPVSPTYNQLPLTSPSPPRSNVNSISTPSLSSAVNSIPSGFSAPASAAASGGLPSYLDMQSHSLMTSSGPISLPDLIDQPPPPPMVIPSRSIKDVWLEFRTERWYGHSQGEQLRSKETAVELFETYCCEYGRNIPGLEYVDKNSFVKLVSPKHLPILISEFLSYFLCRPTVASLDKQKHAAQFMYDWLKWLIDRHEIALDDCKTILDEVDQRRHDAPNGETLTKLFLEESQNHQDLDVTDRASGMFFVEAVEEGFLIVKDCLAEGQQQDVCYRVQVPETISSRMVVSWRVCLTIARPPTNNQYFIIGSGSVFTD